jgi:formylglycine-generating enzyme required for sulfatase activity
MSGVIGRCRFLAQPFCIPTQPVSRIKRTGGVWSRNSTSEKYSRMRNFKKTLVNATICCALAVLALFVVVLWRDRQRAAKPAPTLRLPHLTNSIGMKLVLLPPARIVTEVSGGLTDPSARTVSIRSFYIGSCEVTNAQFEMFRRRPRPLESRQDRQPVTRVSWGEADAFCKWLSRREGRAYRLPTENEWEYAARGGLHDKDYPWGDEDWLGRATFGVIETTPVATHPPNRFGLYDMAGNVEEWTADTYTDGALPASSQAKPAGSPGSGGEVFKVRRGGDFSLLEGQVWLRSPWPTNIVGSVSQWNNPNEDDGSGFRVVLDPPGR